ncbi:MAG: 2OG-Fe(II) oxygenase [Lewinellaceae bacterium]|nr:2OG-Fe(II) oxygenase [Saprospiraceae bacterium]MCB9312081.1 2OG-Fe(II) oxygenase [Lewinellaceae bacterium]HRW75694.1 2OG-Fe(II) oxygenase [Saprospiraceae bacterium]
MEDRFESLIEGLLDDQFASTADFLSPDLVDRLRTNLLTRLHQGQMHPAGIGRAIGFQTNASIRGDLISWLDDAPEDEAEQEFLALVREFMAYLNRTCYTGLNALEFHYAIYGPGSFYKRHKDQFRSDSGRRFSLVSYLNEDWLPIDGGALVLSPEQNGEKVIFPEGGRMVLFKSDEVEHEVLPTVRPRMSITGWLKTVSY